MQCFSITAYQSIHKLVEVLSKELTRGIVSVSTQMMYVNIYSLTASYLKKILNQQSPTANINYGDYEVCTDLLIVINFEQILVYWG